MELSIKHLAPYLPYRLMGSLPGYMDRNIAVELLRLGKNNANKEIAMIQSQTECQYTDWQYVRRFIPFLRPMSDITTEIIIDGNKFIPAEVLYEQILPKDEFILKQDFISEYVNKKFAPGVIQCSHSNTDSLWQIHIDNPSLNPHWVVETLIEWHFDVYKLIDENIAKSISQLDFKFLNYDN